VLALPFQYGSLSLANFFLGVQRPKLALTSGLAQVITNIVISWFLMFGFGEFGGWGIKGAAMGTVVASAIGVAILLFYYLRTSSREMYQTDAFGIHRERMRIVLHVGIPRGILTLSDMFFWTIAMVVYMGTFGTEHLAASAAMYAVVMLFAVPGDGVNEALITVVSFFRSRNREESAVGKLRSSLWINGGLAVILGILMFHFSERIVSWFSTDELVIRIGATLFFFVPWLLMSEAVIASLDGWLTAFEDVRFSTQVTVVSSLLIVVAGGYLMQRYGASYGALGIWLLITLNRMTVAACLHLRFRSGLWHSQPLGSAG
ncbi:MAG: MATE family efflux transporter, partial [Verrucomicrobiota bacterium]